MATNITLVPSRRKRTFGEGPLLARLNLSYRLYRLLGWYLKHGFVIIS
jgi:hypothetical protein